MVAKGLAMTYARFLRLVPPSGLAAMTASLLVLWLQYATFPNMTISSGGSGGV